MTQSVDKAGMFLSVISIGAARGRVEALPANNPIRTALLSNLDQIISHVEAVGNLRVVDKGVVHYWEILSRLDLRDKVNKEISDPTRLVIATALDASFTLITRDEPWVHTLIPLQLRASLY
jgi:predicted nucleic acid-binding protein